MIQTRTKIITSVSVLFFLMCLCAGSVFLYSLSKERKQYDEKRVERAQNQEREKTLNSLTESLEKTKDARASLRTRFLKEEDIINFLTLVETLGKEQSVMLKTSNLNIKPINETFEDLVLNVTMGGEFETLLHTIALFENLPYQTSITSMQISKSEDATENPWNVTFELHVTKFIKV